MNDWLDPDDAHHARYMTWLAVMAAQSGGLAELWVDERDGSIVYALKVSEHTREEE